MTTANKRGSDGLLPKAAPGVESAAEGFVMWTRGTFFFPTLLIRGKRAEIGRSGKANVFCWTTQSSHAGGWTQYQICGSEAPGNATGGKAVAERQRATYVGEKFNPLGGFIKCQSALVSNWRGFSAEIQPIGVFIGGIHENIRPAHRWRAEGIEGCGECAHEIPGGLARSSRSGLYLTHLPGPRLQLQLWHTGSISKGLE